MSDEQSIEASNSQAKNLEPFEGLVDFDVHQDQDESDSWLDKVNSIWEKSSALNPSNQPPSQSNQSFQVFSKSNATDGEERAKKGDEIENEVPAANPGVATVTVSQKFQSSVSSASGLLIERQNVGKRLKKREGSVERTNKDVVKKVVERKRRWSSANVESKKDAIAAKEMRFFGVGIKNVEWVNPNRVHEIIDVNMEEKMDIELDDGNLNRESNTVPIATRRSERLKKKVERLEYHVIIPRIRTSQLKPAPQSKKRRRMPRRKMVWVSAPVAPAPSTPRPMPYRSRKEPALADAPAPVPSHVAFKDVDFGDLQHELDTCMQMLNRVDFGVNGLEIVLGLNRLQTSIKTFQKKLQIPTDRQLMTPQKLVTRRNTASVPCCVAVFAQIVANSTLNRKLKI